MRGWGRIRCDVRLASDGAEAKDLVESYDPEIVISDVVMPQLSGLDLLRCLKAGNPNRPVILVTAHASIDLAVFRQLLAKRRNSADFPQRFGTIANQIRYMGQRIRYPFNTDAYGFNVFFEFIHADGLSSLACIYPLNA